MPVAISCITPFLDCTLFQPSTSQLLSSSGVARLVVPVAISFTTPFLDCTLFQPSTSRLLSSSGVAQLGVPVALSFTTPFLNSVQLWNLELHQLLDILQFWSCAIKRNFGHSGLRLAVRSANESVQTQQITEPLPASNHIIRKIQRKVSRKLVASFKTN